jgi:5'-nucleotidase/UDP-sugar diphosphatase
MIRLLALLVLFSCTHRYDPTKTYRLTILHTNDHHGRFWANRDGEWGLAARATLIQQLRREARSKGAEVLLLDAGDVNTGVPQSDTLDAQPDFLGMGKIGYDAMAVGNHEFDNTVDVIRRQEKWGNFPFLSANAYDSATGARLFKPYVIKDLAGLKVAVLGLTTDDTPLVSTLGSAANLKFTRPIDEAAKLVPELRQKAQVVIALTHMGHYPNESHGENAPGDVTLARQVSGINVIVGGHSQLPLFKPDVQNGAIIVQAYEWGKYVGKIELEVTGADVRLVDYQLIPVNHKDATAKIPEDPSMLSLLRPFKENGDKHLLVKVGSSDELLKGDRETVRSGETNLGNLITEAFRSKFSADLSVTNSGGIRDSLPAGDINYENILTVLPFGNDVVTTEMTGAELKGYLNSVLDTANPGTGAFPQFSGLEVVYHQKSQRFSRLLVGGKSLDPRKTYRLALPSFIAGGGDRYPKLKTVKTYGFTDASILREYITAHSPLRAGAYGPFKKIRILP